MPPAFSSFRLLHSLPALAFAAWLAAAAAALGQSAQWSPERLRLGLGQTGRIELFFIDCAPTGTPEPKAPGLEFAVVGNSSRTRTVDRSLRTATINGIVYAVRASQRGAVRIPAFEVQTDKGTVRVPAAEIEVGEATLGESQTPLSSVVQSAFTLPQGSVWAGEVFPLGYTLTSAARIAGAQPTLTWNSSPLVTEEWSKLEGRDAMIGGQNRTVVQTHTRALAREPGSFAINPAQLVVSLQTGNQLFGIFSQPNVEQYVITTSPANLTVRPLPPATVGFSGAVGNFTLTSKVVPASAAVGDPITWTLELSGTGNWPDIPGLPAREASRDFRVVQPQAKRTPKENQLFDATLTEDVVLIPTKPGTYTVGPVRWVYFDPKAGEYRTLETERHTLTVSAPVATPPPAPVPVGPLDASRLGPPADHGRTLAESPAQPQGIPRDPVAGSARTVAPLDALPLVIGASSSAVGLLAFWVGLALRRARQTDPERARREAQRRLTETLHALRGAPDVRRQRQLLQAWRQDTLTLLGLPRSSTSHTRLANATRSATGSDAPWLDLWQDSDRTLYAAEALLPADWVERAEAALATQTVPKFTALSLFRPRNLMPLLAALLLLGISRETLAADAAASYRRGEFPAAEATWRQRIRDVPTDWIARHNLSLALSQQDRWSEAAAESTAAFMQNPGHAEVRWQLTLCLQRAGYTPADVAAFLSDSPRHRLARLLSPAEWKLAAVGAAWMLALGLGFGMSARYRPHAIWPRRLVLPAAALSLLLAASALISVRAFGIFADSRAAIVWKTTVLRSIPTEADTTQKTTPLPAGSTVRVEKAFLGWRRVAFTNGQTGWISARDLVSVWR